MPYDFYSTQQPWIETALQSKDKSQYLANWRQTLLTSDNSRLQSLTFNLSEDSLQNLPHYSTVFNIKFRLKTPYLSKDETDFYPVENPVRKEWVFKTPMVAAPSWKGALRAALWQLGHKDNEQITRLFGMVRDNDDDEEIGQAGHLYFYPTFFYDATPALEMINPHDRESGVGTVPILLECVPADNKGTLSILYIPPYLTDQPTLSSLVAADLKLVAEGINALLTQFGFGAKTSSGYGAVDQASGFIAVRAALKPIMPESEIKPTETLARYLESKNRLAQDFRADDNSLISEAEYKKRVEAKGKKYSRKENLVYQKAKGWWDREGSQVQESQEQPIVDEVVISTTSFPFHSLTDLESISEQIAQDLIEGAR